MAFSRPFVIALFDFKTTLINKGFSVFSDNFGKTGVSFQVSRKQKNEPSDQTETPTNERQKPLYCSVLKRKSNTNLRRKFSKQNLAYKDNNIKQTVLNARHNRSTSRNKSFEISQQATSERIKKRLFKTKSLL